MEYLVEITKAEDKDLFSTCMDFWHDFTRSIYNQVKSRNTQLAAAGGVASGGAASGGGVKLEGGAVAGEGPFGPVLHALRCVVISKMVMPEEILIEKEEGTGEIIQRVSQSQ